METMIIDGVKYTRAVDRWDGGTLGGLIAPAKSGKGKWRRWPNGVSFDSLEMAALDTIHARRWRYQAAKAFVDAYEAALAAKSG